MKSNEFYDEFNNKIKDMNLEQLKEVINNVIRKIPETKYEEVLNIFDGGIDYVNEQEIKSKIKEYKEMFEQINSFDLYFHATGYEDYGEYYSPWGGDWIWEYTDEDDVGGLIEGASLYAVDLINKRQYKYAKELIDMILYTNYQVLDDNGGDDFEISLYELKKNNLININIDVLCSYAIYATYQYSNESSRAKNIYECFKNENFRGISIEDSFKLGIEVLNDIDKFWNNWICLLLTKAGNVEYRLLKEAFEYNNYANYYEYIDKISDNHPKLYIDIFNYLVKVNKIKEIINIGNRALLMLDNNLKIRNDIALYLAKYDEDNKEKYIIESFKSNTNVPNLLRIINNGYYLKHKEEINKLICINDNGERYFKIGELTKNTINKSEYYFLKFFTGSFDVFFNECSKVKKPLGWSNSFIQYGVYLLLLYFNKNTNSKVYNSMLSDTFFILGFKNNTLFLDDEYSLIFTKWKENFEITNVEVYLKWLETIIGKRVDAIVSNGHRGSYYKAAILVVALGEVLESNDIQSKVEFIDYYHKKYPRHSSFRRELNENL